MSLYNEPLSYYYQRCVLTDTNIHRINGTIIVGDHSERFFFRGKWVHIVFPNGEDKSNREFTRIVEKSGLVVDEVQLSFWKATCDEKKR